MECIIEQFNIDMRKSNLYMSSAIAKYEIECVESMLCESTDDFGEDIFTEASEGLLKRIKQFFANLLQKIKEFFQKLIEKMREFFQRKQVDKLEKTVKANPKVANTKIQVIDIKYIEETYGKRRFLCKALEKKLKNGTLTQDDIDDAVEKYDKLGKTVKVVGITVGAVLTLVTGGVLLKKMGNCKETVSEDNANLEKTVTDVINSTSSDNIDTNVTDDYDARTKTLKEKFDNLAGYRNEKNDYINKNQYNWKADIYKKTKSTNKQIGKARAKLYRQVQDAAKNNANIAKSAQELATLNTKAYNDAMKEFADLYKTSINLTNEQMNVSQNIVDDTLRHMTHSHKYHDIHKEITPYTRDSMDRGQAIMKQVAYQQQLNQKRRDSERIAGMLGIDDPMAKK